MVQLEDDFIFKLKKNEMEINKNNIRRLNVEISPFVILTKALGSAQHFSGSVPGAGSAHRTGHHVCLWGVPRPWGRNGDGKHQRGEEGGRMGTKTVSEGRERA